MRSYRGRRGSQRRHVTSVRVTFQQLAQVTLPLRRTAAPTMRLHLHRDAPEGSDNGRTFHEDKFVTAWFRQFREALLRAAEKTDTLEMADVIVPDLDTFTPHFPCFLEACCTYPLGGKQAFFQDRLRRWLHLWHFVLPRVLPRMKPTQRLLLLDVESDHTPGSKAVHSQKRSDFNADDHRVVHVSLCLDANSYRPGVDVSFPAVLPAALGSSEQRRRPIEKRPYLLSFKGRRTHGVRLAIFALHNGRDIMCVDSSEEIAGVRAQNGVGYAPADEAAKELHASSRFALCPRGDAVYSFRMAEALSCGAVPVIIGDGWVLPFSELLDYRQMCICVRETPEELGALTQRLRALTDAQVRAYQAAGRAAFETHMKTLDAQAATLLQILAARRGQSYEQSARHQVTPTLKADVADYRTLDSSTQWRAATAVGGAPVCTQRDGAEASVGWRARRRGTA